MVDPKASKAFLKFVKDWQPDVRIAGGDHFDMRPLRRKADEHEKRESLRSDIEAGTLFLKQYEPHHLLLGNHEMRLYYILDKAQGVMLDCELLYPVLRLGYGDAADGARSSQRYQHVL